MSSTAAISAAVSIFIVSALLYYQARPMGYNEGFISPPVAGRPYGAFGNADETYPVPADLDKALPTKPTTHVPTATQRPTGQPGAGHANREAMAARKDLNELDNKITTWLDGAGQREKERPGSLTHVQLQRRVMLQGRLADVRTQMTNGLITDSYRTVAQETADLRRANSGWRQASPSLEQIHDFASGVNPESFLTEELYTEFRRIFDAGLLELNGQIQPDPLQRVRHQQLQLIKQDFQVAERQYGVPPIRVSAAKLFLQQMLKPDQPLPTIFSMEPNPATLPKPHEENPADVLNSLRDINWKLSVSYDPAGDELKRSIAAMMDRLQSGAASPAEVIAARSSVAALQTRRSPAAAVGGGPSPSMYLPLASASGMRVNTASHISPKMIVASRVGYDPKDLVTRANRLCHQIREAFPHDAEALGCQAVHDTAQAETVINTVCDRLRTSVPSVSPAQFNCPSRAV